MRSWILAGALCTMALGQTPSRPTRVIDTSPHELGREFSLFVTSEGRVLAHAEAKESGAPPRVGIWEASTGIPVRLDLPGFDPDTDGASPAASCGGTHVMPWWPILSSNQRPSGWDPAQRCFALTTRSQGPQPHLNEHGDVLDRPGEEVPTARAEVRGFTELWVTRPDGGTEMHRYPMAEIPNVEGMTGIQKVVTRMLGFRNVLVSREGDWVAATWMGGKRNLPNRALPWIPDGTLRWLLFREGDLQPVMDLPLFALAGVNPSQLSLLLSPKGDRILLEVPGRVLVLDPHEGKVVLNRAGSLAHLTILSDELILARDPGERDLMRLDLRDGRVTGTLTLPTSLDPPSAVEDPDPERTDPSAPRRLTGPLAFSPDGRWTVGAQERRGSPGWDALVLWAFLAP